MAFSHFHGYAVNNPGLNITFTVGANIIHKKYGFGTVVEKNDNTITATFENGQQKKFGLVLSTANNIISVQTDDYAEQLQKYREILKKETTIKNTVSYAENNFALYAEYLE